jgi:hypothetical protein
MSKLDAFDFSSMDPPLAPPCSMESVDYMLLRLDEIQGNTINIAVLFWFEGHVPVQTFTEQMLKMCRFAPKLCQIPIGGSYWSLPQWVDVRQHALDVGSDGPLWEVKDNIQVVDLELPNEVDPHDDAVELEATQRYVAEFLGQVLDPHRPLWRLYVMRGLREKTAMLLVLHHALTDGAGLAAAIMNTFTSVKTAESYQLKKDTFMPCKRPTYASYISMLINYIWIVLEYFWLVYNNFILNIRQKRNILRYDGPKLYRRSVAWSKPISMEKIKRVRTLYPKATLNDVILASISKAFRRYVDGRRPSSQDPTRPTDPKAPDHGIIQDLDQYLSIAVPLAMRQPNDTGFANRAIAPRVFLPVFDHTYTNKELLAMVRYYTNHLKRPILFPGFIRFIEALFDYIPGLMPVEG